MLSRILSTEALGILNISLSIFGMIAMIICSGISITIARHTSINYNSKKDKLNAKLIYNSLIITLVLGITTSFLLIILKDVLIHILSSYQSYLLLICMIPAIISNAIYTPFKAYMMGRELYFDSSIVELIEQILRIVACFGVYLCFKNISPEYSPAIAMSVAGVVSTIIGIYYYKKNGGKIEIGKPELKKIVKNSTPITLVKVLSTLLIPLITIIVPIKLVDIGYSTSQALSSLGIMTGMTLPLLSIPGTIIGSLATALIPQISLLGENKNNNNIISKQIQSSIKFTILITTICIPIFISLGRPICELVFNNIEAGNYLIKASWIIIPMGISQITTTILNSLGKENKSFLNYIVSTVFVAVCIIFMTESLGIESIIWALGASNTYISIANIYYINRYTGNKNIFIGEIIFPLIICAPIVLLTKYLYNIFAIFLPSFICIAMCCGICLMFTFVLLVCFGIIDIKNICRQIKFKKIV